MMVIISTPAHRLSNMPQKLPMNSNNLENLRFQDVTPDQWHNLERLFERRGGPMYCWCMPYRRMSPTYGRADTASKKDALHQYVMQGTPIGILAFIDDQPIAWCSIAPIQTYRNMRGKTQIPDAEENVWSIACFFIHKNFRRQGMTRRIIIAAIDHARENGATIIEAYPVDPDSPSYRFMGYIPTFQSLGFKEVGKAGTRRHIMQLRV